MRIILTIFLFSFASSCIVSPWSFHNLFDCLRHFRYINFCRCKYSQIKIPFIFFIFLNLHHIGNYHEYTICLAFKWFQMKILSNFSLRGNITSWIQFNNNIILWWPFPYSIQSSFISHNHTIYLYIIRLR